MGVLRLGGLRMSGKDRQINIRLDEEEFRRVQVLGKSCGGVTAWIRIQIEKCWAVFAGKEYLKLPDGS